MAIKISSTYAGRVDNNDPAYPYGKGRNIVGGVKGTGTPFEADWYNNLEGFLQGLLTEAGIIPDGDVDTADRSQLVEAIKLLIGQQYWGDRLVGSFESGLTYTDINQTGTYDNNGTLEYYVYTGGLSNLPHTVPSDTNPTNNSNYQRVNYNSSSAVINDDGSTAQDAYNELNDHKQSSSAHSSSSITHGGGSVEASLDDLSLPEQNTRNLADAWIKLSLGAPVTILCQGDSMTAGYDVNSPDIVPPDNGDHVTHAAVQYPLALENILSQITGANHTVINQGYSGDTAKTGFDRWTNQVNADVCHLMYGINDSQFAFGATFPQYFEYMESWIKRLIGWGIGVVIHTPTAQTFNVLDKPARKWAAGIRKLAEQYNCPVFESANVMQYAAFEGVYSDGTHFNSHGYQKYGDAVAAFCASGCWVQPEKRVSSDTYLSVGGEEGVGYFAPRVSLIYSEDGSSLRNTGSGGPLQEGDSVTWSFYQDCEVLQVSCAGILSGLDISFDTPHSGFDVGDLYVNKTPLRYIQNKGVEQTRPYTFQKEALGQGRQVKIGLCVGRGWKNVTFKYPAGVTGNKYIGGLFLKNISESVVGDPIIQGNGVIHKASQNITVAQWPYSPSKQASTVPSSEPLPSVLYIPMPEGLIPVNSSSFGDYYDNIPVEIDIYGTLQEQTVKGVIVREQSSTNMVFRTIFEGTAGLDMKPTAASWAYESYDKASESGSGIFSDGYPPTPLDNLWLKLEFNSSTASYYQIIVKSASKVGMFQP